MMKCKEVFCSLILDIVKGQGIKKIIDKKKEK
jgi:hypothetical protein